MSKTEDVSDVSQRLKLPTPEKGCRSEGDTYDETTATKEPEIMAILNLSIPTSKDLLSSLITPTRSTQKAKRTTLIQ